MFRHQQCYLHLSHVLNWSTAVLLAANIVVDDEDQNTPPDRDASVHATRSGIRRGRDEYHHLSQKQENKSDAIAHESVLDQVEPFSWELLASNALPKNAENGQEIG